MLSHVLNPVLPRNVLRAAVRSRVQPFSTNSSTRFGALKNIFRTRPTTLSPLSPYKLSRTIITDAQVVTPASSQEAWKKFAVTAVRNNSMHLRLSIQVCRLLWQAPSSLQKVS